MKVSIILGSILSFSVHILSCRSVHENVSIDISHSDPDFNIKVFNLQDKITIYFVDARPGTVFMVTGHGG
jgi:hypothetical protein